MPEELLVLEPGDRFAIMTADGVVSVHHVDERGSVRDE